MQLIGGPVTVQNTDAGHWLVTMHDAVTTTAGESLSFTVAVHRKGDAKLSEVERQAAKRALEMLQALVDELPAD